MSCGAGAACLPFGVKKKLIAGTVCDRMTGDRPAWWSYQPIVSTERFHEGIEEGGGYERARPNGIYRADILSHDCIAMQIEIFASSPMKSTWGNAHSAPQCIGMLLWSIIGDVLASPCRVDSSGRTTRMRRLHGHAIGGGSWHVAPASISHCPAVEVGRQF